MYGLLSIYVDYIFENTKNGLLFGHTDNYIKIKVDDDLSLANTIQKVNILEMSKDHMVGRIIKN